MHRIMEVTWKTYLSQLEVCSQLSRRISRGLSGQACRRVDHPMERETTGMMVFRVPSCGPEKTRLLTSNPYPYIIPMGIFGILLSYEQYPNVWNGIMIWINTES